MSAINDELLLRDQAIDAASEDLFSRGAYVEGILNSIIDHGRSTGITIGIVGPWGHGKTSILNLVAKEISARHPDGVIVQFNPWIISNRNDLFAAFFRELITAIAEKHEKQIHSFRKSQVAGELGVALSEYGTALTPLLNFFKPGVGPVAKIVFAAVGKILQSWSASQNSPKRLKERIEELLQELDVPVVILVDEVDRVEDSDVKALAQLVRAVADFKLISYVIAYDDRRVVEALGSGIAGRRERYVRGRKYLEKIVQIPVPLPIIFDSELANLLQIGTTKALKANEIVRSSTFDERYDNLIGKVLPSEISNARDVRRIIANFSMRLSLVAHEVDPVDVLGLVVLEFKAPVVSEYIRKWPDRFVYDGHDTAYYIRTYKLSAEDKIKEFLPPEENSSVITWLLTFLFPFLERDSSSDPDRNRIAFRRPLLTLLRMGLLPGTLSRRQMIDVLGQVDLPAALSALAAGGSLQDFITRVSEVYAELEINDDKFWTAVARATETMPAGSWVEFDLKRSVLRSAVEDFLALISRGKLSVEAAIRTINAITKQGHLLFAASIARRGRRFLSDTKYSSSLDHILLELAPLVRAAVDTRPSEPQFVFLLKDAEQWTEADRHAEAASILLDDSRFDAFVFNAFGGIYSTDRSGIELFVPFGRFEEKVRSRISAPSFESEDVHLKRAYEKAAEHFGFDIAPGNDPR